MSTYERRCPNNVAQMFHGRHAVAIIGTLPIDGANMADVGKFTSFICGTCAPYGGRGTIICKKPSKKGKRK